MLLRCNCPGFLDWGIDMLVKMLVDENNLVAQEALDILDEACDDPVITTYFSMLVL